ncbi:hypothetical protein BHM03_00000667 [Ensete ventricosum]|nr:hypothetical protein BHM03_00000667 [Ensete ventricosum]
MSSVAFRRMLCLRSIGAAVMMFWMQRRRSRINEKMRALQNLIPNSNKVQLSVTAVKFLFCLSFLADLF